jgi:hypothetical protein
MGATGCYSALARPIQLMQPTKLMRTSSTHAVHASCVQAPCVYCILETIESVCGVGCVTETLHIAMGSALFFGVAFGVGYGALVASKARSAAPRHTTSRCYVAAAYLSGSASCD